MFVGSRLIKTIVLILGVFLLVINIVLWANDTDLVSKDFWDDYSQIENFSWWSYDEYVSSASPQNYYGFRWFFDKLSTFPGLRSTLDMFQNFSNVISNFDVTGNYFADIFLAIFRILFTPVMLVMTLVLDIFQNVSWFISFIIFSDSPIKIQ